MKQIDVARRNAEPKRFKRSFADAKKFSAPFRKTTITIYTTTIKRIANMPPSSGQRAVSVVNVHNANSGGGNGNSNQPQQQQQHSSSQNQGRNPQQQRTSSTGFTIGNRNAGGGGNNYNDDSNHNNNDPSGNGEEDINLPREQSHSKLNRLPCLNAW